MWNLSFLIMELSIIVIDIIDWAYIVSLRLIHCHQMRVPLWIYPFSILSYNIQCAAYPCGPYQLKEECTMISHLHLIMWQVNVYSCVHTWWLTDILCCARALESGQIALTNSQCSHNASHCNDRQKNTSHFGCKIMLGSLKILCKCVQLLIVFRMRHIQLFINLLLLEKCHFRSHKELDTTVLKLLWLEDCIYSTCTQYHAPSAVW